MAFVNETAPNPRTERPTNASKRVGRPFQAGNPGRPRGVVEKRRQVGIEVARAMSGHAAERLAALVDSRVDRVSLEAVKLVLGYSWGMPRQVLELQGFGDLSRELTAALAEARARRATLAAAEAIPAFPAVLEAATLPSEGTNGDAPASAMPETNTGAAS